MKYKVIGWTFQENYDLENAPLTFASRHAIVDEIKKHGYLFSGYEHQEAFYGCPVLNDGKKRMLSQRGFAGIIAEARGELEPYTYAKYMFGIKKDALIVPDAKIDKNLILSPSELFESFELSVNESTLNSALTLGEITLDDLPYLRYVDSGDTLTLLSKDKKFEFSVLDVDRKKLPSSETATLTIKVLKK